jgi:hypothetical protein
MTVPYMNMHRYAFLRAKVTDYLGSSVNIASDYNLDDRSSIPGKGKEFFSSPEVLELWGVPPMGGAVGPLGTGELIV